MAYPLNVKTRLVSFGGAATVEAGTPLHIRVSTESSRSLIWVENGYRLESLAALYMSATDGQEIIFEVPTTDQNGWLDAATRQAIIVEPGEASHLYTTKLEIFTEDHELIRTYEIGPYAVPEGPGVLDADLLNPNYDPIEGTLTTYIPGPEGASSTIESATAVGLAAGAAPTVTLGGTPTARTFAFGIPKGDKGDKGDPGDGSVNSVNGNFGPDVVLDANDVGAATQQDIEDAIASIAQRPDLIGSIVAPFYIAHRGGRNVYPEHSLEAYQASFDSGYSPDADVRALADGTLVCLHDATTGRTMTGSSVAVNTMTLADWKTRQVLPPTNGAARSLLRGTPVLFEDYLDRFGGRTMLFPEVKSSDAVAGVIAAVKARNLEHSVVLSSFDWSHVDQFVAAGIYAVKAGVPDRSAQGYVDAGVIGAAFNAANTSNSVIADFKSAGLLTFTYTLNTPSSAAAEVARGVDGIYTDDPWGVNPNTVPVGNTDLSHGFLIPGMVAETQGPDQAPVTVSQNALVLSGYGSGPTRSAVKLGHFGKGNGNATIRFKVHGNRTPDMGTMSASWLAGFYMGKQGNGDGPVTEDVDSMFRLVIIRANGQVSAFRKEAFGATATRADGDLFTSNLVNADGTSKEYFFEIELTTSNVWVRELYSGNALNLSLSNIPDSDLYPTLANNRMISSFTEISFAH